jgi:hypothetical protein
MDSTSSYIGDIIMAVKFSSKKEIVDRLRNRIELRDSTAIHALVFIYDKQVEDEKLSEEVRHRNGVGFTQQDAKKGSWLAKWYLNKGFLTVKQMVCVKKMVAKYAGQIVELKINEGEIKQIKRGEWIWG